MSTQRYYPMLFLLFKILKLLHALVVQQKYYRRLFLLFEIFKLLHALVVRPCSSRNTIVGYFYYLILLKLLYVSVVRRIRCQSSKF
jgi:hypothetical protein